jgi:hypothetical protein
VAGGTIAEGSVIYKTVGPGTQRDEAAFPGGGKAELASLRASKRRSLY